jgi:methionyl-tRNA synthetase
LERRLINSAPDYGQVIGLGKFYITTAIDYPNDKPHVGHSWEKIAADVLARFHRLLGDDVFFLTGTDDHGQKIERAAAEAKLSPKELVDKMVEKFKAAWSALGISYDKFIRTTDPDHEKRILQLVEKLIASGDIYHGTYEGWYCVACEAYYTEKDLIDGKLDPVHHRPVERVKEEGWFFRLSKYQKKLLDFYKKNPEFLSPKWRAEEIISRVKSSDLKDISITRATTRWGIPFPKDPKLVLYVWLDALPNYITAIGWPEKKYEKYWPADLHLVGKEINWFHTVLWPAILMSAGIELPKRVYAHGWLTVNGQKISKTTGNVVDPLDMVKKYGADPFRYFMLRQNPFGEDGDFSEKSLITRNNSELADSFGNLVQRVIVLTEKQFDGKVPTAVGPNLDLSEKAAATAKKVEDLLAELRFHDALSAIFEFIAAANAYINETKPWAIKDKAAVGDIIYNLLECLRVSAIMLYPFIPGTSEKILSALSIDPKKVKWKDAQRWSVLKSGQKVNRIPILFKKVETK